MRWIGWVALLFAAGVAAQDSKKQAPKKLAAPAEWGVGAAVAEFSCPDTSGKARTLSELATDRKALVLAFTAVDCPVAKLYRPKLERLEKDYRKRGVAFAYVHAAPGDKPDATGIEFPVLHDKTGALGKQLKATRTTDAFVIDATKVLRYRGAVDDQYGLGYSNEKAVENFLVDALESVLKGADVAVKATEAPG
jgi:peroxiredoxin